MDGLLLYVLGLTHGLWMLQVHQHQGAVNTAFPSALTYCRTILLVLTALKVSSGCIVQVFTMLALLTKLVKTILMLSESVSIALHALTKLVKVSTSTRRVG